MTLPSHRAPLPRWKVALRVGAALIALAFALAAIIRGRGPLGPGLAATSECRAGYDRARTAADTAAVDAWTPVTSEAQAAFARSCAQVRRDGDL